MHNQYEAHDKRSCVAFGDFDGMHTGHMAVITKLLEVAGLRGLAPVLISFNHDNDKRRQILTTENEKRRLLPFEPDLRMVSLPKQRVNETFIRDVLVGTLRAAVVVAGANYRKLELLRAGSEKYGFELQICDVVKDSGAPVSTLRIAKALKANDLETANRLMGHPYIVCGTVVKGKQLGRTIGFPTANIDFAPNKLLPYDGVYVTTALMNGVRRPGLANIGLRPTVDNFDYRTVENFIMDFSGDLYGEELHVEVLRFIRGVKKFDGLNDVKQQVTKDMESVRSYVARLFTKDPTIPPSLFL